MKDTSYVINVTPTNNGIRVYMPNGTYITSTHTGLLNIPQLPLAARHAHIFANEDLVSGSLLSIGMFCDAGLNVVFTKQTII